MSDTQRWFVHLPKSLFYTIRGQPPDVFNRYVEAVAAVNDIAQTFSRHNIESCQGGFLVAVEGEHTALRCVVVGQKKEIHIAEIIEYEPED